MYKSYAKALLHVAEDTNRNGTSHNACRGLSTASGYTARQNAVGSAQEHSIVSWAQMFSSVPSRSVSTSLSHPAILNPDY